MSLMYKMFHQVIFTIVSTSPSSQILHTSWIYVFCDRFAAVGSQTEVSYCLCRPPSHNWCNSRKQLFFLPETIWNLCYDFSKFVVTTKGTLEHHIYHEWHRSTWHPSVRFCFVLQFFGSGCSEHFSQIHDTSTLDCLVDTIPYSHQ